MDLNYQLELIKKSILDRSIQIDQYRDDLSKIDSKLLLLNDILYIKDSWSRFLQELTTKAKHQILYRL